MDYGVIPCNVDYCTNINSCEGRPFSYEYGVQDIHDYINYWYYQLRSVPLDDKFDVLSYGVSNMTTEELQNAVYEKYYEQIGVYTGFRYLSEAVVINGNFSDNGISDMYDWNYLKMNFTFPSTYMSEIHTGLIYVVDSTPNQQGVYVSDAYLVDVYTNDNNGSIDAYIPTELLANIEGEDVQLVLTILSIIVV